MLREPILCCVLFAVFLNAYQGSSVPGSLCYVKEMKLLVISDLVMSSIDMFKMMYVIFYYIHEQAYVSMT